ncbi:MAG TPA: ABC transporter permease [Actinomycetales bacterium]|nr:ABC transporter permease [Actinomycetales bacterium]
MSDTRRGTDMGGAPTSSGSHATALDVDTAKSGAAEEAVAGGEMRQASLFSDAWKTLRKNPFFLLGSVLLVIFTTMAVVPQLFTGVDPRATDLSRSQEGPSAEHWFGFDIQGADYFANVVYGARISMSIGVLTVIALVVIAVLAGSLAGFYGGWADSLLSRVTDVFYGLPLILGAIILLSTIPNRNLFTVSLALITFGWMTAMRLVRSTVISVKEADYVQAARAMGASTFRILLRHILPNAIAPVLVYATIAVGQIIAAEATLSFLGIGLQLPEISWGLQISSGQTRLRTAPHLVFFPGLLLSLTVLAFILMGDALREALDPKLR